MKFCAAFLLVWCGLAFSQATQPPGNPSNSQTNLSITTAFLYNNKMSYQGAWSSTRTYSTQDLVTYSGVSYISIGWPNLNQTPATSPSWWVVLPGSGTGGGLTMGGISGQLLWNSAGAIAGVTVGGDCTFSTATGVMICTKTNAVSFAPSATTDTTNAGNISAGTLGASHLPLPAASTVGGVQSKDCSASSQFVQKINTDGSETCATPSGAGNVNGPGAVTNGYLPQWGASNNLLTTGLPVSTTPTANTVPSAGSGGTLAAGWLPLPTVATVGGVDAKDCSGTGHVQKINSDGSITCAADAASSPSFPINSQTATYQVLTTDFSACKTIAVSSGTFTVTLVASGSQPANGQCVWVLNYGTGTVTLARSGQNINGVAANLVIPPGSASAPASIFVVSDGTNYNAFVFCVSPNTAGNLLAAGVGSAACPGDSGMAPSSVFTVNGTGGVNQSAAGVTNISVPSATTVGARISCAAVPSTVVAGGEFCTSGGQQGNFDGTNADVFSYVPGSGATAPTAPTTGHAVGPWLANFGLQDGGPVAPVTLTDAATVTWSMASAQNQTASLLFTVHSGSRTLNITGPLSGGYYTLKLTQDGTGGEGLLLGTGCTWQVLNNAVPATTVTLSAVAAGVNVLSFYYDGTNCVANFH